MLTYSDVLVMPGDTSDTTSSPLGVQRGTQLPFASSSFQKLTTAPPMTQVRNAVAWPLKKNGWKEGLSFIDNN